MPAPWGPKAPTFPRPKIESVVDRCLTLRQLRELQEFVQRLCKAGLVRYPDEEPYRSYGCAQQIVKWTCINQYEINSQIIKRVIPKDHSCSWVELVADGCPQRVRYFCSHYWGEAFRDFVATIEGHAREHRVKQHEAYFICVYANDQHQVQLGRCLQDSPFYHALSSAEMTVVLLDKHAEALVRIWCVFEMHETTVSLKKPLQVWTPQGRVGSPHVSSGPAVAALGGLDTAKAKASRREDKRRILNHIAGKREDDGLHDPGDAYEQALIQNNSSRFAQLDNTLRDCTVTSLSQAPAPHFVPVSDMALRGMTLAQLRALAQEVKSKLARSDFKETDPSSPRAGERITWEWANFYHVASHVLRPQTEARKCSFAELVAGGEQPPDFTICLWWGCCFKDFIEAVEWHAEARNLPDSAIYWAGPFAFNHWEAERPTAVAAERVQETVLYKMVKNNKLGANGVLVVLDRHLVVMSRLWPMLEVHLGIRFGRSIDLATWSGALATTRPFPGSAWEVGSFDEEIADHLLSFDVSQCRALVESDRRMILNFIAGRDDNSRKSPSRTSQGYEEFSRRFRAKAAGPALRAAAFRGDLEMIEVVAEACPGLVFSAQGLCGALGETALHAAAAAGHPDVAARLLELLCEANAQDAHGETPLHYAALAGRAEVVTLLLQKRADPHIESFAAETPLQVASQNACKFLGMDARAAAWALDQCQGGQAPATAARSSKAVQELQAERARRRELLKSTHWDHFREEECKVESFMAKLVAKQDSPGVELQDDRSRPAENVRRSSIPSRPPSVARRSDIPPVPPSDAAPRPAAEAASSSAPRPSEEAAAISAHAAAEAEAVEEARRLAEAMRRQVEEAGSLARDTAERLREEVATPLDLEEDCSPANSALSLLEAHAEVLNQTVSSETFGLERVQSSTPDKKHKGKTSKSSSRGSSRPTSQSGRRKRESISLSSSATSFPAPGAAQPDPVQKPGASQSAGPTPAPQASGGRGRRALEPNVGALAMLDPRCAGVIGFIAFYFPGQEEVWDVLCQSGFLGNFWELGKNGMQLKAPCDRTEKTFTNSESAFQALKFWDKADLFRAATGDEAHHLKKKFAGNEDWSYAGYGHSWAAMMMVLRAKFAPGTPWAEGLLKTGDCYLLNHSAVHSKEAVWSDNHVGDGSNWLGLLLMLRRDELFEGAGRKPLWTGFIRGTCQVDLVTGKHGSNKGKDAWQSSVQAGAKALAAKLASLGAAAAAPPTPPAPTGTPAAPAAAAASLGPTCKRPGCGRPTWNGQPNEFCSKSCSHFLPALPAAPAKAPPKPQYMRCMRPGCGKATWNGQPNEFCSKACKNLAGRP